jgi:hypothetical protein
VADDTNAPKAGEGEKAVARLRDEWETRKSDSTRAIYAVGEEIVRALGRLTEATQGHRNLLAQTHRELVRIRTKLEEPPVL